MYQGKPLYLNYHYQLHQRKKRKQQQMRRVLAMALALGLAVLFLFPFGQPPQVSASAAPEQSAASSAECAQQPGEQNPAPSAECAQQPGNQNPGLSAEYAQQPGNQNPGLSAEYAQQPGNQNPGMAAESVMPPAESGASDVSQGMFAAAGCEVGGEADTRENAALGETPESDGTAEAPLIFIDAGHGGMDEGCARGTVWEKDINLAIARRVQQALELLQYRVMMAREDDTYIAKEERVRMANEARASLYVSIHQNAADDAAANGIEVWYDEANGARGSKRLAQLVSQQTLLSTGAQKRAVRGDADFHVTGSTNMPACLIETGFLSHPAESRKLASLEYQEQLAAGIVQGVAYYFHPKTMYLTFDDGPSKENTARVLDILKEQGIKATFFLVGENVEKHPDMARRIVAEGHAVGIHCYRHDYGMLYESVDSYIQDFEKARRIVYEVTGVDTKLFRFPGGSVNDFNRKTGEAIAREMTRRGYVYFDWNASLEDAVKTSEPQELIANALNSTLGRKKVIMLAHDVVYHTGVCLDDLLECFPEYEMRTLGEEVEPIRF